MDAVLEAQDRPAIHRCDRFSDQARFQRSLSHPIERVREEAVVVTRHCFLEQDLQPEND